MTILMMLMLTPIILKIKLIMLIWRFIAIKLSSKPPILTYLDIIVKQCTFHLMGEKLYCTSGEQLDGYCYLHTNKVFLYICIHQCIPIYTTTIAYEMQYQVIESVMRDYWCISSRHISDFSFSLVSVATFVL